MGDLITFWLGHWAAGAVSLPAVLAHVGLVTKIMEEKGVDFVWKYLQALHGKTLMSIREGECLDLSATISRVDESIMQDLKIQSAAGQQHREPPKPPKGSGGGGAPPPPKQAKAFGAGAGPRGDRKLERAPSRPPVCFAHDPANGKTCPELSSCSATKEHLDTNTEEGRSRFDNALKAFRRRGQKGGSRRP